LLAVGLPTSLCIRKQIRYHLQLSPLRTDSLRPVFIAVYELHNMFQITYYRCTFLNVSGLCNIHLSEFVSCGLKLRHTYITIILNAIALITTAMIVITLGGRKMPSDADTAFSFAGR
jgi:hypothetical protein